MARSIAFISKKALRANVLALKEKARRSKISAVVKDDAYGHSVQIVVESIDDLIDGYSVATIEEGVQMRMLGVTKPVWILTGFSQTPELDAAKQNDLTLCVNDREQLSHLFGRSWEGPIIPEIDTGMGRLGFSADELTQSFWDALTNLRVTALMSHFSSADNPRSGDVDKQLNIFDTVTRELPFPRTIANSGGVFGWPRSHLDWVRPGLALYGVSPLKTIDRDTLSLTPAMQFKSRIISVRNMEKGQPIGYSGTFICPEAMPVGIIGCGYGDGYPRSLSNRGIVRVGSSILQVIGTVSMDSFAVDLRDRPHSKVGEEVTLWGSGLAVETIAQAAETIPNELLVRITKRVQRRTVQ